MMMAEKRREGFRINVPRKGKKLEHICHSFVFYSISVLSLLTFCSRRISCTYSSCIFLFYNPLSRKTLFFFERFRASWTKPEIPDYFSRLENLENQHRKAFLMAITEQSKRTTKKIIEENIKKMETSSLTTEPDSKCLATRLNNRLELRKSCFPSLLGGGNSSLLGTMPENKRPYPKADSYYKGTTYFMPETMNGTTLSKKGVGEKTRTCIEKDSKNLSQNGMKMKFLPKIEVTEAENPKHHSNKLKKIIKRKVVGHDGHGDLRRLGPNGLKLNHTVLQVTRKTNSKIKLDGTTMMRNENSVFTKHWS